MQDEEINRWSEASVLIWPVQPGLWLTFRWWIIGFQIVFILHAITAWDRRSILYLAHDDVPMATDGDNISIHSTEEMWSTSLSTSERLVTLMYTMWTCSRGLEWTKIFPSSSELLVGENSMEGIRQLERRMDDFATVQTEMQASIVSQTSMMHDLFDHFGIYPNA
jgi:hypothetical protein